MEYRGIGEPRYRRSACTYLEESFRAQVRIWLSGTVTLPVQVKFEFWRQKCVIPKKIVKMLCVKVIRIEINVRVTTETKTGAISINLIQHFQFELFSI